MRNLRFLGLAFAAFVALGFAMAAPAFAQFEPLTAEEAEEQDLPILYLNETDVEYWEENEDNFKYRIILYLSQERGQELYELSLDNVGEYIAIYFGGRFLTTIRVMDEMPDDTLPIVLDGETRDRLKPALPVIPEGKKKPVTRVIKQKIP